MLSTRNFILFEDLLGKIKVTTLEVASDAENKELRIFERLPSVLRVALIKSLILANLHLLIMLKIYINKWLTHLCVKINLGNKSCSCRIRRIFFFVTVNKKSLSNILPKPTVSGQNE